jgi:hypothetical protein
MKLADSWVEDDPAAPVLTNFHDEVEEHDEVDEVKDGCGGVQRHLYVLKKGRTSNKMLHELAREVRGVENRRGKRFSIRQYKVLIDQWAAASKPYLRAGPDYFTEFLAKLDCVTVPKGETLEAAFERANLRQPPAEVLVITNEKVRQFASLCRELQEMAGDQPFMMHQVSIGKLFGCSWRTIGNWIKALKTVGVLKLAEPAIKGVRAARYFYVAPERCTRVQLQTPDMIGRARFHCWKD